MVLESASTGPDDSNPRLDLLDNFAAIADQLADVLLKRALLSRIESLLERIVVAARCPRTGRTSMHPAARLAADRRCPTR